MPESRENVFNSPDWPCLETVQRWFQTVVTHPEGIDEGIETQEASALVYMARNDLEQMVTRSKRLSARDRIAIYANAYYARLLECLGDTYRVVKGTLGDDAFTAFAFDYLQKYPSKSYTLGKLGEQFPGYLEETRHLAEDLGASGPPEHASWPDFLVDLARLEWTIGEVFDGPGIEGKDIFTTELLGKIKPEEWPSVKFKMAPCVRLMTTRFPVNEYYTTARQNADESPAPLPSAVDSYIAITRREYVVRRHELTRDQYVLLNAIGEGLPLGDAIDQIVPTEDAEVEAMAAEIQSWFRDWTQGQFFEAVLPPG